ncbi:hypothetical protein [Cryobacterium sp. PH31-L1]|uniref:hypothetical protein n=1 Tax=Cryobacterium sp. PH31-L1 TaxID=3046199 RepID=UPI0024BA9AAE|nr:hypothetical protein [Cryobacterium sp. PH31-L1]MDJ0376253.1 hypothetical protein [Cryobacterium sp. PH31-L1]
MNTNDDSRPVFNEARSAAMRAMLVDVAEIGTTQNRRFRVAPRTWTVVPAALLVVGLSAGMFFATQPVTDDYSVACFARAELDWRGAFPGTTGGSLIGTTDGTDAGSAPITDAIAFCSDLWAQHALDATSPNGTLPGPGYDDRTFSHPVPSPLTECVMKNGAAAVIPGGPDVRSRLGLASKSV